MVQQGGTSTTWETPIKQAANMIAWRSGKWTCFELLFSCLLSWMSMFLVAGLIGKDVNAVKTCGLTDKQTVISMRRFVRQRPAWAWLSWHSTLMDLRWRTSHWMNQNPKPPHLGPLLLTRPSWSEMGVNWSFHADPMACSCLAIILYLLFIADTSCMTCTCVHL